MNRRSGFFLCVFIMLLPSIVVTTAMVAAGPNPDTFEWVTVVNKNDIMPNAPPDAPLRPKSFNSFNQPSVNMSEWWC